MQEEEDDDNGTVLQGTWVRKYGHMSEHDIDARWILYYPNDERPHGSLRIVSHHDLPPGHLRSFMCIITKRWPKTQAEKDQALQNYGLLNDSDLFLHNGVYYKTKVDTTYYLYNKVLYKNKKYRKEKGQIYISYHDPINEKDIYKVGAVQKTQLNGDEFSVVTFNDPIKKVELQGMNKSLEDDLAAYCIDEHVETWDNELVDKKAVLEKMFNVKVFE